MRTVAILVSCVLAYTAAMGNHGDSCSPSPCGPNTDCTVNSLGVAICRCKPGYFPKPDSITGCGPQCTSDDECKNNEVCGGTKCVNPCTTSDICGTNAVCETRNHRVLCRCPDGYSGDPFTRCTPSSSDASARVVSSGSSGSRSESQGGFQSVSISSVNHGGSSGVSSNTFTNRDPNDFCSSFSCGSNADCFTRGRRPVCTCRSGFQGDPYSGCRRAECTDNADCSTDKVCHNFRCIDPCSTSCGINADCTVRNHVTVCRCPAGFSGDPFVECRRGATSISQRQASDYCSPSPCGANANCRAENGRAICSCKSGYIGDPIQGCRLECDSDADCSLDKACVSGRCQDPCGSCAEYAECRVQNHRAVCRCPDNFQGDPYTRCFPECTQHESCPSNRACFNFKCTDPCQDACGEGANCRVENHKAICSCPKGYTGHPFDRCRPFDPIDLCTPNPCGTDAVCKAGKDRNNEDRPVCSCRVGYIGDPLTSCRRGQCTDHADCPDNKACYGYECKDPCTSETGGSVCGTNARCDARNHGAICSCRPGYKGDPLTECTLSSTRG